MSNRNSLQRFLNNSGATIGLTLLGLWGASNFFAGTQGFSKENFEINPCVITQEQVGNENLYKCQYTLSDSPDPDRRQTRELLVKGVIEHTDGQWTRAIKLLVELDPTTGEIKTDRFGAVHPLNVTPVHNPTAISTERASCQALFFTPQENAPPSRYGRGFRVNRRGDWFVSIFGGMGLDYNDENLDLDPGLASSQTWFLTYQEDANGRAVTGRNRHHSSPVHYCRDTSRDNEEMIDKIIQDQQEGKPNLAWVVTKEEIEEHNLKIETLGDLPDLVDYIRERRQREKRGR